MLLLGLPLVIVFVSDIERSQAWYRQTLELPLLSRHGDFVRLGVGESELALHPSDSAGKVPANRGSMPVFQVEDYAASKAKLTGRGVHFVYEDRTPVSVFGTLLDPDGNQLQIMQRLRI